MQDYYSRPVHLSLRTRPKGQAKNDWGEVTERSRALFLLQSFPGIGPTLAEAIIEHFGRVPLAWTCTKEELMKVNGIGKKRAEELWSCLS
jgi:ERCC4-type nuclease